MFAVMKHWDLMLGIDRHIPWPPSSPLPLPAPVPFVTTMILMGLQPLTPMMAPSCMTLYGWTMQRGTDIGPLIPHVGMPSLLTPLDMAFSSSVSYFGPTAYQAEAEPCAAALLVAIGLNANCQEPVALPTGLVLCITTHFTMMTFFDVLFGFGSMLADAVLDCASCQLSNVSSKYISKHVTGPIGKKLASKAASKTAGKTAGTTTGSAAGKASAGSWSSASPGRAPSKAIAGAHRPSQPSWKPASPSPTAKKPGPTIGGHRPEVTLKKQPTRKQIMKDIALDIMKDLGMEAPMSLIHMLGMELLDVTGIEEFGAAIKGQDA